MIFKILHDSNHVRIYDKSIKISMDLDIFGANFLCIPEYQEK